MVQEVDVEVDPVEEIPDEDRLYKRVHRKLFKDDGEVMTGAFHDSALSVDWSRYSTPEQTRDRASSNPKDSAVIAMGVGAVRQVPGQTVQHTPKAKHRAHWRQKPKGKSASSQASYTRSPSG